MQNLTPQDQLEINNKDRVNENLHRYTNARIGIGHTGGHMLTANWLKFQLDFAGAKDAVMNDIDLDKLAENLAGLGLPLKCYPAESPVISLHQYLTRPDLGRSLSDASKSELTTLCTEHPEFLHRDILIVISAGLSSLAIQNHTQGIINALYPLLTQFNWSVTPLILSKRTRVAFADKVNAIFKAKMIINFIGERPGLSSNDSMSIYFTYNSKIDSTDEQRNCISNIHQNGLSYTQAAQKLCYLIHKAFKLEYSGVNLKDDFAPELFNQALQGLSHDA